MTDNNEHSFEDDFFNQFLSDEFLAEQQRLHQQLDEHLKKHYNYEHDEEEVRRLLANTDEDEPWSSLCTIGPVRIMVHEYTPGVLKRKA
jgi:hypothetical protein